MPPKSFCVVLPRDNDFVILEQKLLRKHYLSFCVVLPRDNDFVIFEQKLLRKHYLSFCVVLPRDNDFVIFEQKLLRKHYLSFCVVLPTVSQTLFLQHYFYQSLSSSACRISWRLTAALSGSSGTSTTALPITLA